MHDDKRPPPPPYPLASRPSISVFLEGLILHVTTIRDPPTPTASFVPPPPSALPQGSVLIVTVQLFYGELFVSLGYSVLLTAATVMQLLMWASFLMTCFSDPG